jgi:hypothetical protein
VTSQSDTLNSGSPTKTRKVKAKNRRGDRYSFILLIIMLMVALASGIVTFIFGQRALIGVSPVPADGRLPKNSLNDKKQKIQVPPKGQVAPLKPKS